MKTEWPLMNADERGSEMGGLTGFIGFRDTLQNISRPLCCPRPRELFRREPDLR
jgi:hypothetical protein